EVKEEEGEGDLKKNVEKNYLRQCSGETVMMSTASILGDEDND
ncbi:6617_t:CDS:1, partial [Ambispora leptoticha]